jgi:hypothetical protein
LQPSKQKNIKRLKRMKAENLRKSDQRERIERQIRKAERKDITLSVTILVVATLLISSLIYVGVKTIISIF